MIPAFTFAGRRVAVFGLGRSGLATCRSLAAGGAEVLAWDDNEKARNEATAAGFEPVNLAALDWTNVASLVLAPGVPLTHPKPHWTVELAREAGVEVIGDVEIFARERAALAPDTPFIAITGTNGKSTTTALMAHVLKSAGRDVQMGGNIGVPILSLEPPAPDRFYVVEMSSYQIDLTPTLEPTVGVLLNVSPDHIDRHGTFENYARIKRRLVECAATAVISVDDAMVAGIAQELIRERPGTVPFSCRSRLVNGLYCEDRFVYRTRDGSREAVADLKGIATLRGDHNAQNVMAVYGALEAVGHEFREMFEALPSFPGLAHRMQQVANRGKVIFVNDSKATNAESAAVALASYDGDIYWIAGGLAKEGGIAGLADYFPRLAGAYLIGEAAELFAAQLAGQVNVERCDTLANALVAAARDAALSLGREPVVLLAPACASFDQYTSFEARGDHFVELVRALPGDEPDGGSS